MDAGVISACSKTRREQRNAGETNALTWRSGSDLGKEWRWRVNFGECWKPRCRRKASVDWMESESWNQAIFSNCGGELRVKRRPATKTKRPRYNIPPVVV